MTRPWLPRQRHSKPGGGSGLFSLFHSTRRGLFLVTGMDKDSCESSLRLGAEPTHSSSSSSDFSSPLFPLFQFFFLSLSFWHFHFTHPPPPSLSSPPLPRLTRSPSNGSHFVCVPQNVSFTLFSLTKCIKSFDIAAEKSGIMCLLFFSN